MDDLELYLTRAVLGAAAMMKAEASQPALFAFHYAVGLALMGPWAQEADGTPVPKIVLDALDAMHIRAHVMADEGFDLSTYTTPEIAQMHTATRAGLALMQGGQ